jgi:hypothetical protein
VPYAKIVPFSGDLVFSAVQMQVLIFDVDQTSLLQNPEQGPPIIPMTPPNHLAESFVVPLITCLQNQPNTTFPPASCWSMDSQAIVTAAQDQDCPGERGAESV